MLQLPFRSLQRTAALAAAVVLSATALVAQDGRGAVNLNANGVILHGYDAVAYHTAGEPVMGSEEFTATHDGATYRFASAANRDTFLADPARYAPAYGGYCAMGVAVGQKYDVRPEAFRIVDGRLYMNKDLRTQRAWARDIPGNNDKADTNWPQVMRLPGFGR